MFRRFFAMALAVLGISIAPLSEFFGRLGVETPCLDSYLYDYTGVPVVKEDLPMPIYDRYDFNSYLVPYWEGDIMCNESVMFVENADGTVDDAPLLYSATEIISVRSFDLLTEYVEGEDYVLRGGKLALTANSRIYRWKYTDYYPQEKIEGACFEHTDGGYIAFGEVDTFFKTQVSVTYRHSGEWSGIIPGYIGARVPKTIEKLKSGAETRIVFYGDSITTGANSSRTQAPFAPMWSELTTAMLADKYNNPNIVHINTAVGGTTSGWGVDEFEQRVSEYLPDLVVLAFGMNDGDKVSEFNRNIISIIKGIRKSCPDTEFILVSTTQPNPEVKGFYRAQYKHEDALERISVAFEGTAVAPMWSMHGTLLASKRFYDMTGNNVNHPNDFLARLYAQTLCAMLIENY